MTEDTLIHLDGLKALAAKAATVHELGMADADGIDYSRLGVCTADLMVVGDFYVRSSIREAIAAGGGIPDAMKLLFLAGFDLGYQAALEVETRREAEVT